MRRFTEVLRDRSTELLVSLFVKDIVGRSGPSAAGRTIPVQPWDLAEEKGAEQKEVLGADRMDLVLDSAFISKSEAEPGPEECMLIEDDEGVEGVACVENDAANSGAAPAKNGGGARGGVDQQKSMWGITQALDLIDSAWGFASLDEDDAFLPSLDEDDIPIPAAGGRALQSIPFQLDLEYLLG